MIFTLLANAKLYLNRLMLLSNILFDKKTLVLWPINEGGHILPCHWRTIAHVFWKMDMFQIPVPLFAAITTVWQNVLYWQLCHHLTIYLVTKAARKYFWQRAKEEITQRNNFTICSLTWKISNTKYPSILKHLKTLTSVRLIAQEGELTLGLVQQKMIYL